MALFANLVNLDSGAFKHETFNYLAVIGMFSSRRLHLPPTQVMTWIHHDAVPNRCRTIRAEHHINCLKLCYTLFAIDLAWA